jgi:hypothetical protein
MYSREVLTFFSFAWEMQAGARVACFPASVKNAKKELENYKHSEPPEKFALEAPHRDTR